MQSAADILKKSLIGKQSEITSPAAIPRGQTILSGNPSTALAACSDHANAVAVVFECMARTFPRKFSTIWPSTDAIRASQREWLLAFAACKFLTADTLRAGLDAVRECVWPPDNPGEFLAMCHIQPSQAGAPELAQAWNESCRQAYPFSGSHPWSHRCVYWAAIWTGLSVIHEKGGAALPLFELEYRRAVDRHRELDEPPAAALPSKSSVISFEQRVATDLAAEKAIAELHRILSQ